MTEDKNRSKRTSKPPAHAKQSMANDAKLRRMVGEGLSQNQISKELGVSRTTVSSWMKRLGLESDNAPIVAMVVKSQVDLRAGRTRLAEKMLAAAEKMIDNIDEPYLVYNFGGKDNTYEEHILDSAPVEVRRNIMTTAAIAFDKISRIVDADPDLGTAETAIRAVQKGLMAAAQQLKLDGDTQTLLTDGEGGEG